MKPSGHRCWAILRHVAFAGLLSAISPAGAVDAVNIDSGVLEERGRPGLESAFGFIVDRTITHFGAEFVRYFSQEWRDQPGTEAIDVTIVERPSARWGSIVFIEHNQRPIARVFLYAGRSATIRPLAAAAARHVAVHVSDNALAALITRDPDLAKDGF